MRLGGFSGLVFPVMVSSVRHIFEAKYQKTLGEKQKAKVRSYFPETRKVQGLIGTLSNAPRPCDKAMQRLARNRETDRLRAGGRGAFPPLSMHTGHKYTVILRDAR